MLRRLFNACLLRPNDVRPSRDDLEVAGVFNPGAIATDDGIILLVRVAEQAKEHRPGFKALPRWDPDTKATVIDWGPDEEHIPRDQRVILCSRRGVIRLTFISHLLVIRSRDGRTVDSIGESRFEPANDYEEYGVEDPRITRIGDKYYFTYVAVSRHGAATALASTRDFKTFERHGIIFFPENKDVVLFPEKIGGQYFALHRPTPAQQFCKPEIWIASSPDLINWGEHSAFLGCGSDWDVGRIGGGTPPLRTPKGWVEIYHGNSRKDGDCGIGIYSAGAVLLDAENPRRIIGRTGQILVPETDYECRGFVPNVVFPTGIVEQGENLLVYYGAADAATAVVEFSLGGLLNAFRP
jgi:predicted GH43/DUF377 family glycosyl hydrolase